MISLDIFAFFILICVKLLAILLLILCNLPLTMTTVQYSMSIGGICNKNWCLLLWLTHNVKSIIVNLRSSVVFSRLRFECKYLAFSFGNCIRNVIGGCLIVHRSLFLMLNWVTLKVIAWNMALLLVIVSLLKLASLSNGRVLLKYFKVLTYMSGMLLQLIFYLVWTLNLFCLSRYARVLLSNPFIVKKEWILVIDRIRIGVILNLIQGWCSAVASIYERLLLVIEQCLRVNRTRNFSINWIHRLVDFSLSNRFSSRIAISTPLVQMFTFLLLMLL